MSLKKSRIIKGVILVPDTVALENIEGELKVDSADSKLKTTLGGAAREVLTNSQTQTLTNKTFDANATGNSISNLETADLAAGVLNTNTDLSGATDSQIPSALAVKTYLDSVDTDLGNHISNPTGAHAATAISNTPAGTIAAITVQAAINELDGDIQAHINDTVDAHDASAISNVPSGNLVATTVQAALDELQSDIDTRALNSALTSHTSASSGVHGVTGSVVGTSDSQALTNKTLTGAVINGSTLISSFTSEETQNNTQSGSAVVLTGITKPIVRLTNASLVSVTGIDQLETLSHGGVITLVNATGVELSVLNNAGVATQKILTGTDDDLDLAIDGCLLLKYDAISDLWRVIGGTGAGGATVVKAIAGENLAANEAVYLSVGAADSRTAGQAYKLDASNANRIKFIGFVKDAVSAGGTAKIITSGIRKGFTGLSAGSGLWLSATTPGAYVQTEPTTFYTWTVGLGIAISATQVLVLPDQAGSAYFNDDNPVAVALSNNVTSPTNITSLAFDGSVTNRFTLDYRIFRSTSLTSLAQAGQLRGVYNSTTTTWYLSDNFTGQNAEITFSITSAGQIQYVSSNLSGTGHSATLSYNVVGSQLVPENALLISNGDMLTRISGVNTRLPIGTDGQVLNVSASGIPAWTGTSRLAAGSAAAPSYTFQADPDTGVYRSGTNQLSVTTGATEALRIDANQATQHDLGTAALPSVTFIGDADTGIYRASSNVLGISTGGAERFRVGSDGLLYNTFASSLGLDYLTTLNPGYLCRAWINFNGTVAAASMPRAAGNISSVTDNGVGDYTLSFSTAMPDVGYAVAGICRGASTDGSVIIIHPTVAPTTSAVRIMTDRSVNAQFDSAYMLISIFR